MNNPKLTSSAIAGLSLIGQAIKQHTDLSSELDASISRRHGINHTDVIKSYLALLSMGKNDFEATNIIESDFYFMRAGNSRYTLRSDPATTQG